MNPHFTCIGTPLLQSDGCGDGSLMQYQMTGSRCFVTLLHSMRLARTFFPLFGVNQQPQSLIMWVACQGSILGMQIPATNGTQSHQEKRMSKKYGLQVCVQQLPYWHLPPKCLGSHGDVGGGSRKEDESPPDLSHISLRWMIRECYRAETGIRFNAQILLGFGFDSISVDENLGDCGFEPNSELLPRSDGDARDILVDVTTETGFFSLMRLNWLFKILPFTCQWETGDGVWTKRLR